VPADLLDAYFKEQAAPAVALRTDGVEMAAARLYTLPERGRRHCSFEVEDLLGDDALGDDAQPAAQLAARGKSAAFEVSAKAEREALSRYSVLLAGDEPSDDAEKFDLILVRYSIFLYSTNTEDSWLMLARILARLAPLGVLVLGASDQLPRGAATLLEPLEAGDRYTGVQQEVLCMCNAWRLRGAAARDAALREARLARLARETPLRGGGGLSGAAPVAPRAGGAQPGGVHPSGEEEADAAAAALRQQLAALYQSVGEQARREQQADEQDALDAATSVQHLRSLLRLPQKFAEEPQKAKEIEMNARSLRILRDKEGFSETRVCMCRGRQGRPAGATAPPPFCSPGLTLQVPGCASHSGASHWADQGSTRGCGAAVRPGQGRKVADFVGFVTQVCVRPRGRVRAAAADARGGEACAEAGAGERRDRGGQGGAAAALPRERQDVSRTQAPSPPPPSPAALASAALAATLATFALAATAFLASRRPDVETANPS
jgi:hypothetical protein